jgi:hypothetical protein
VLRNRSRTSERGSASLAFDTAQPTAKRPRNGIEATRITRIVEQTIAPRRKLIRAVLGHSRTSVVDPQAMETSGCRTRHECVERRSGGESSPGIVNVMNRIDLATKSRVPGALTIAQGSRAICTSSQAAQWSTTSLHE